MPYGTPNNYRVRGSMGKFMKNTPENRIGVTIHVCEACRRLNPVDAGEPAPEKCHACGATFTPKAESDLDRRRRENGGFSDPRWFR